MKTVTQRNGTALKTCGTPSVEGGSGAALGGLVDTWKLQGSGRTVPGAVLAGVALLPGGGR